MTDTTAGEGVSPVYTAALETLRKGAPGLSDDTRKVLASTINRKVALSRPALSPPAEGEGRGDDYEGPDAGMHDTEIDDRDDEDTTPAPAETFEGFNLSNIKRTDAPAVDWNVVGPKLVWLIERVDAERKRETVRLNHLKRAVAAVAAEARAALAAAQPEGK